LIFFLKIKTYAILPQLFKKYTCGTISVQQAVTLCQNEGFYVLFFRCGSAAGRHDFRKE